MKRCLLGLCGEYHACLKVNIVCAKLGQAIAEDNEVKLVMKHAPGWVRTSNQ